MDESEVQRAAADCVEALVAALARPVQVAWTKFGVGTNPHWLVGAITRRGESWRVLVWLETGLVAEVDKDNEDDVARVDLASSDSFDSLADALRRRIPP